MKKIKEISNINEFIAEIQSFQNNFDTLIYRGQSDETWEVESGVYRRIKESKLAAGLVNKEVESKDVIEYLKDKIYETRKRLPTHYPVTSHDFTDLELLVEMQHFGGATNLIDFSFNSLIGLYFSCLGRKSENGRVFCINYSNTDKVLSVANYNTEKENFFEKLKSLPNDKFFAHTPIHSNFRIIKQASVFLFNDLGYLKKSSIDYEITIKGETKDNILQELKDYFGISEESIYPDFLGYLQANNHRIPFKIKNAKDYYDQAIKMSKNGEYERAINFYQKSIELDKTQHRTYLELSRSLRKLKRFHDAEIFLSQGLEIKPDDFYLINEYGIVQTYLQDFTKAKKSFERSLKYSETNPILKIIHKNNMGWMYLCFQEYDNAIKLLEPLLNEPKPYHPAINLGHIHLIKNEKDDAIKYYKIACENAITEEVFWKSLESDYFDTPIFSSLSKSMEYEDYTAMVQAEFNQIGFKKTEELGNL